jgi:hypothetical protein
LELNDALTVVSPEFATVAAAYVSSQVNFRTAYKTALVDAAARRSEEEIPSHIF